MLEVCTSTVAWISVVVIQALVHYFVLGARREKLNKETEAVLEESLSFSTIEDSDECDVDRMDITDASSERPSLSSISYSSSDRYDGNVNVNAKLKTVLSTSTEHQSSIYSDGITIPRKAPMYLMQTGTEMLEVRERVVVPPGSFSLSFHTLTHLMIFYLIMFAELLLGKHCSTTNSVRATIRFIQSKCHRFLEVSDDIKHFVDRLFTKIILHLRQMHKWNPVQNHKVDF